MPEGDTVFRVAHELHTALAGRTLTCGQFRHPRLATVDPAHWQVVTVGSTGKHLFVRFGNDRSLHSHLRMDGSWHLYAPGERWRLPGHLARVVLECPERVAVGFRLHDLALLPTTGEARLVGHLGPDLLAEQWTPGMQAEALRRLALRPERTIGLTLLDQTVMAGIGNVYLVEICFLLGVCPFTPLSALSHDTIEAAVTTARSLLRANRLRLARSTTGEHARGRRYWVYQRAGEPCRRCGTLVQRATLDTGVQRRETWWCPHCQPETP